jgi:putative ABC transport system permease protein
MNPPGWTVRLLRRLAPAPEADILVGDLEEAHRARVARRGSFVAAVLTALESLDFALMLVRRRLRLPRWSMSWLDLKLAMRMLVRYPVLSVIGTVSLAAAIALGASAFAFISLFLWPRMPLPDGDKIVLVAFRNVAENDDVPVFTADYLRLRAGASTLTDFAAGRVLARNLAMGDGIVEPIQVAEVTASMFGMVRVAPIAGRALTDDDASAAAPPVMVLGERLWRERFGGDPAIIGKSLLVSDRPTTVVGIMPAGFRFPSVHEVWQPLKIDAAAPPRAGTTIRIWARLKPDVDYDEANAELAVISTQAEMDWPSTHKHIRASVGSPMESEVSNPEERILMASMNGFVALLVLLVSGNVALLMFARAATRESEIVVRTALGASRGRLVAQFFTEALVLSAIGGTAGLLLAQQVMEWGVNTFSVVANDGKQIDFWITPTLPPISIAYGIGLAVMAAAVTGILPAVKMTRAVSSKLRETTAGGGGLSFGGVWTVAIVGQIAVTMVFPVIMFFLSADIRGAENRQIGVPADRYLTAALGQEGSMPQPRFEALVRRVRDELAATPGIGEVTVADRLPLSWNGHYVINVEGDDNPPSQGERGSGHQISTASVEPDYFAAFEAEPIVGRLFTPGDYVGPPRVVVVNESFVQKVLGGRNAIGRRFHYTWASNGGQVPPTEPAPAWLEIVGVVRDMGMAVPPSPKTAGVYVPLDLRQVNTVFVAARVTGDMASASNALRTITRNADPTLRVADVRPLSDIPLDGVKTIGYVLRVLAIAGTIGFTLALSGLYAVMSFAVSRRTREIGIRMALGSTGPRVVFTILRRPMIQAAMGSVLGGILAFLLPFQIVVTPALVFGFAAYVLVVFVICLIASIAPARRALRVDPISALRAD